GNEAVIQGAVRKESGGANVTVHRRIEHRELTTHHAANEVPAFDEPQVLNSSGGSEEPSHAGNSRLAVPNVFHRGVVLSHLVITVDVVSGGASPGGIEGRRFGPVFRPGMFPMHAFCDATIPEIIRVKSSHLLVLSRDQSVLEI